MMRAALLGLALLAFPALAAPPTPSGDPEVAEGARLVESGRYELGLPVLEAALARLPGDPDILVYIAFAQRRLGNRDAAMEAYLEALGTNPNHPGALAYQGSLLLEMGDRPGAEANLAQLTNSCGRCAERETLARDIARAR